MPAESSKNTRLALLASDDRIGVRVGGEEGGGRGRMGGVVGRGGVGWDGRRV